MTLPVEQGEAQGYRSAAYVAALSGFGLPVALGDTGGHLLSRAIPGNKRHDLAGPYPVLCCTDWTALGAAMEALPGDPVSVTLVTDAFCPLSPDQLAGIFDLCRPLHDHYLIDLTAPLAPSRHHRRKLRQKRHVRLEAGPARPDWAEDWIRLYATLARRKDITDLRAFPPDSLAAQLAVPGAHMVTAWEGDSLIGADLYYLDRGVAYAHLSAYAEQGYAQSVSYPMIATAAEYLAGLAEVIDLGGAPAEGGGGIADFKRGWTSLTRPSHLCGKVCDAGAYAALPAPSGTAYFPAYRAGEFGNRQKGGKS